jgi:hypothetical protein
MNKGETMSEAIFGLIGVIIGAIIGAAVSIYVSHRESADRFKLVALEKRLAVHQQAYSLWRDLMFSMNSDEGGQKAYECERWWQDNCLYLDKKSSDSFHTATLVANTFGQIPNDRTDERKKDFYKMHKAGKHITEGIGLPHLEDKKSLFKRIFNVT